MTHPPEPNQSRETAANALPRAGRREWIGLAVIALPCLLYSMDLTVLNLAVPQLSADLAPGSSELLWIVDIYGFLVAGSLITMGMLGDRIGRRRLLLIGAAGFGVASVLAAFSTSAGMLIVARALLGVAGATLAPSTLSLIRNMFLDGAQRTFAIGIWVSSYSVGGAIGPLVGGVLLEHFWWGSVFLLGVPVMVLLLVVGPVLLPEYRDPKPGRIDLASAGMSLAAVLAVIFGLKQVAETGLHWLPALPIAAGLGLLAAFVRRQRNLSDPLIDLRLFRSPAFSASLAAYLLAMFLVFGVYVFFAQYLQLVVGLTPLEAGLWTAPWPLGFVVGSLAVPRIVRSVQPAYVMAGGLAAAAVGFAVFATLDEASGPWVFVGGSLLFSLGLAPVFTLATDLVVGAAPPERAGTAAALSETSSELGGALGIAILGSIGIAVYRNALQDGLAQGLPPAVVHAAQDTLGSAIAASRELSEPLGTELLDAARGAFVLSLQVTSGITAALSIGLAVVVLVVLGRRQSTVAA